MEGVGRVSEAGAGEVGVCEVWCVNNAIPKISRRRSSLPSRRRQTVSNSEWD